MIKGFDEGNEKFCKWVCKAYNITFADRVRKSFTVTMQLKETDKNLQQVVKEILPKLPAVVKHNLEKYINKKTKLYA